MASMRFFFCTIFGLVLVAFRRSEKKIVKSKMGYMEDLRRPQEVMAFCLRQIKPFFSFKEIKRIITIISRRAINFFIIALSLYELLSLSFKLSPSHSRSGSKETKTSRLNLVMPCFVDEKLTG